MAGATAVPQKFYRRFAEFARQQGYDTLTLDYRGIGQSAPNRCVAFAWTTSTGAGWISLLP